MYNSLFGKGNCVDQIKYCASSGIDDICSAADNFCAFEVESLYDIYAGRDEYDIRGMLIRGPKVAHHFTDHMLRSVELTPDPFPEVFFEQYLNTPKVQSAVGAFTNYSEYSSTVGAAFGATGDDGRESCTIEDIQLLLQQGVHVILYAGDADYVCNLQGVEVVADKVNAPGYSSAGFVNIATSDLIIHGQVKQAGSFAFVRIFESGHEVPYYQPLAAQVLFERALHHKDIATGRHDINPQYRTVGTPHSLHHEGNGTVQFEVVDQSATYNTTTNMPNSPTNSTKS